MNGGARAAKKPRWSMERQDNYEGPHPNPGHDPRVPPLAPLERFRQKAPSHRWQFSNREEAKVVHGGALAAKKPRWSMERQDDYEGRHPNPGHDPRVPPLAPLERFRPEAPSRRWQFSGRLP